MKMSAVEGFASTCTPRTGEIAFGPRRVLAAASVSEARIKNKHRRGHTGVESISVNVLTRGRAEGAAYVNATNGAPFAPLFHGVVKVKLGSTKQI